MTCSCEAGTVWFDHDAGRWRTTDHTCGRPAPKSLKKTKT